MRLSLVSPRSIDTFDTLWAAIRQCWCSSWSPGGVDYARRMHIDLKPASMAIIVQEMVPAERSGVIFSVDPLTGNPWRFVLNATFGLAQDLVAGDSPADQFVLDWDAGKILERKIAEKQMMLLADKSGLETVNLPFGKRRVPSLTGQMIKQLWQLALRLDRAFDRRVDVEWGFDKQTKLCSPSKRVCLGKGNPLRRFRWPVPLPAKRAK